MTLTTGLGLYTVNQGLVAPVLQPVLTTLDPHPPDSLDSHVVLTLHLGLGIGKGWDVRWSLNIGNCDIVSVVSGFTTWWY